MKKLYFTLFFFFTVIISYAVGTPGAASGDTSEVKQLDLFAFNNRFANPAETKTYAQKALKLAKEIGYSVGIAESYRILGVGQFYLNKPDSALTNYFESLKVYESLNNKPGQAKVFNNIGNLYQEADYKLALEYFNKAEAIAIETHNDQIIASINLNRGNIYYHKNQLQEALKYYTLSYDQFTKLDAKDFIIQCTQDLGIIYFALNDFSRSEKLLVQANHDAKAKDMNSSVASINLRLFDIYLSQSRFAEAEQCLKEGQTCAQLINNDRDLTDYDRSWYELEYKRKNYQAAIGYITKILEKDSVTANTNLNTHLNLATIEKNRQNEIETAKLATSNASQRFWLLAIVVGLLLVVIGLLMTNVRRKATTNNQLTELNNEVSRQKDNLDRINHHLEEIIDERTRDLQAKNKKLSEYSSYLSHQIRGPIATLKGLMNLEKEGLIDQPECIGMMDKCVSEIDEKIMEMSDMLHDPGGRF